ncbi:MAG: spore coat protein U domain-containing protein [Alkalispirochaeta sp.]
MKKLVVILTILLVAVSMGAFAQTDSATLNLSGTVGDFVSIAVSPEPAATSLALSSGQASQLQVATVTLSANVGYDVSVNSTNAFNFTDGAEDVPYELYYDGTQVTSNGDNVESGSSANGATRPVAVTYNAAPSVDPGTYSDTVTFTIDAQ